LAQVLHSQMDQSKIDSSGAEEAGATGSKISEESTAARSQEDDRELEAEPGEEDSSNVENDTTHKFSLEETVVIFDWDDTVMPSSWVQEQGLQLDTDISAKQQAELGALSQIAQTTITCAMKLGTVLLVTNAERGWIELSCQKFLPELFPLLSHVKILSARSAYECADLPTPFDWKLRAFETEIARVFAGSSRRRNLLSFGDSSHEREALITATAQLFNCRTKSLKFVERPNVDQLCRQHEFVASCLAKIVHHDGNLDLNLKGVDTSSQL